MRTRSGLAGASETAAFDEASRLSAERDRGAPPEDPARRAARARACDFARSASRSAICKRVWAAYFAPLQGGPYVSSGRQQGARLARAQGLNGIGQSSWGPTGFVFVPSEAEGEALLGAVRARCARSPGSASSWRKDATKARKSRRAQCKFAKATPIERLCRRADCAKAGRSRPTSREKRTPMAHPRILHMITPLKHMSPFDVNMALDAGLITRSPTPMSPSRT